MFSHVSSPGIYPANLQVLLTESSGQWWWHWQNSFFCGGAGAVLSPSFLVSMLSLPELRKGMLSRKLAVREEEKATVLGCIARLEMKALNYFYLWKFKKVIWDKHSPECFSVVWNGHDGWGLLNLGGIRSKVLMFKFCHCQEIYCAFSIIYWTVQIFFYCITQVKSLVTPLSFLYLYSTQHRSAFTEAHKNQWDLWYSRQNRTWAYNLTKT